MATKKQNLRIRTGTQADGKPDYLIVGFITEERFPGKDSNGGPNIRKRAWIHASILNPVLFAQARTFIGKASYICLDPQDLPRGQPGPEVPVTDPDEYVDEGQFQQPDTQLTAGPNS